MGNKTVYSSLQFSKIVKYKIHNNFEIEVAFLTSFSNMLNFENDVKFCLISFSKLLFNLDIIIFLLSIFNMFYGTGCHFEKQLLLSR